MASCRLKAVLASMKKWRKDWAHHTLGGTAGIEEAGKLTWEPPGCHLPLPAADEKTN